MGIIPEIDVEIERSKNKKIIGINKNGCVKFTQKNRRPHEIRSK